MKVTSASRSGRYIPVKELLVSSGRQRMSKLFEAEKTLVDPAANLTSSVVTVLPELLSSQIRSSDSSYILLRVIKSLNRT